MILFSRRPLGGSNNDLWLMRADNPAGAVPLSSAVNNASEQLRPSWSADGQWIIYVSDETGTSDLFAMKINPATLSVVAGSKVNLTNSPTISENTPDWNPVLGDNRISYVSNRNSGNNADGNSEIFVSQVTFNANGIPSLTSTVQVTSTTTVNGVTIYNNEPQWSPDGSYLAYATNRRDGTDADICRARVNASSGTWMACPGNLTSMRFNHDETIVAWDPIYPHDLENYIIAFVSVPEAGVEGEQRILILQKTVNSTAQITQPAWSGSSIQRFLDW
jgi:Tol biopolymer transport system component